MSKVLLKEFLAIAKDAEGFNLEDVSISTLGTCCIAYSQYVSVSTFILEVPAINRAKTKNGQRQIEKEKERVRGV